MNTLLLGGVTFLALGPALVVPLPVGAASASPAQTDPVMRMSTSGDTVLPRPLPLREFLRQPGSKLDDPATAQPYRLSTQDRQRLREQLRGSTHQRHHQ